MKNITYLLVSIGLLVLFAQCKKAENHSERYNNLLGKWKQSGWGVDSNKNGMIDSWEFTAVPADQIFEDEYHTDGTAKWSVDFAGSLDEGYSNWALLNNEQTLRSIDNQGKPNEVKTDYSILNLTNKELVLGYADTSQGYVLFTKE